VFTRVEPSPYERAFEGSARESKTFGVPFSSKSGVEGSILTHAAVYDQKKKRGRARKKESKLDVG
jgi:hypothetical protein